MSSSPNYFEFYELPLSFLLDEAALKKQFYRLSRQYHPDFFVQASEAEQEKALELSTLNTQAYKVLSQEDGRIKYLLQLKGMLEEGERYQLPPSFLVEMMDLNETLMDLQMEDAPDLAQLAKTQEAVTNLSQELANNIAPILKNYVDTDDNSPKQQADLKKVKEYYYKKRYLLRIKESLDKFAH